MSFKGKKTEMRTSRAEKNNQPEDFEKIIYNTNFGIQKAVH